MEWKRRKRTIPSDYTEKFDYTTFAQRLDTLLKRDNMTQSQLADSLGVNAQTVYRWKRGNRKTPIDYKTICTMAKLFHVEEKYMYDSQHTSPHQDDECRSDYIESLGKQFKPFMDFLDKNGMDVELMESGEFYFWNNNSEYGYFCLEKSEMERLMRKTLLFVQMELIGEI